MQQDDSLACAVGILDKVNYCGGDYSIEEKLCERFFLKVKEVSGIMKMSHMNLFTILQKWGLIVEHKGLLFHVRRGSRFEKYSVH